MMKLPLILSYLLVFTFFCGQPGDSYGLVVPEGASTYWYKDEGTFLKQLSLEPLDSCIHKAHYRLWNDQQVIDLTEGKDGSLTGTLTTWTYEAVSSNEPPTHRMFFNTNILDGSVTHHLRELFVSSGVLKLPSSDSIEGWLKGRVIDDGTCYYIDYVTPEINTARSFCNPKSFLPLKEAVQVQTFVDSALLLADAEATWQCFSRIIPFEAYKVHGYINCSKAVTARERKKYYRERQQYRRKMKKAKNLAP